jgi:hypothetical protein
MSWFKRIKAKRCLGDVDNTCPKFLSGEEQNLALTSCDCGSSLEALEETNKPFLAFTSVIGVAILGGSALAVLPSVRGERALTQKEPVPPTAIPSSPIRLPPTSTSTPNIPQVSTTSPLPTPTPLPTNSSSPSITPSPQPNPSQSSDSQPPSVQLPPLPTEDQVKVALSKLSQMNPDCVLEFPVDGESRFKLVGFRSNEGKNLAFTAYVVKGLIDEGYRNKGKFAESDTIQLISFDSEKNRKLVLKPLSKEVAFGQFVRSLNVSLEGSCSL